MDEDRILILAPRGRDAAVVSSLLARSGHAVAVCPDAAAWLDGLRGAAATSIVTEEALLDVDQDWKADGTAHYLYQLARVSRVGAVGQPRHPWARY